ncbi:MAG TPA: hypothetical protein ENH28_02615 [Euryarchaeota archaeon]|nr:2-dehydropantoate 2-reductase [archaeon BMS3Bbin15]HDL15041.1 hypothetical protein [Euryarchaeota archaeon]
MLQDIEKGRKTEIDFLNGAIARLGKKHGIDVPYNNSLVALIKFLEYNSHTSDNLILSPTSSLRSSKNSG